MLQRQNAVILARVSSKSQEDEGYSLDSQLKLLTSYFDSKGIPVIKTFKITETASKEQGRKVFHELLSFIKQNNVYHLGVEKTDRLTRNYRDALAIDDWLEANEDRRLHAVKENLLLHKNSKSDVKFMWNIHLAVAKKYTDNLREEAMKGWAEKLAQGWLPATPPLGYMTVVENGKRIHVPDPDTAGLMKQIFTKYLEPSESIASIADEMNRIGLTTRMNRPYYKSKVQKLLKNPFYIGVNHFDDKDYPGAQDPIIAKELFDMVQKKMHLGRPSVLKKHNPVFKNLIKCKGCGGVVTWQKQKGRYYGACQRNTDSCRGRSLLREDKLEEVILNELNKLVCPSPEIIEWVASSMREEHKDKIENRDHIITSINTQLSRIKRMDEELYDDKLSGDISREKYDDKHESFKAQKAELEARLARIDDSIANNLEKRLVILELAQKASSIYQTRTPEQKRLIITKLFKDLTASDGTVSVNYTNFSRAIAQNVIKTNNLLGGKI
ncbi:MAG TPA: recombinase family protein [Candidatus Saccharimonadales bacterium]